MSARNWLGVLVVGATLLGFSWFIVREMGWGALWFVLGFTAAGVALAWFIAWCFA